MPVNSQGTVRTAPSAATWRRYMTVTAEKTQLLNFVGGEWKRSAAADYRDVINPATGEAMAAVPLSPAAEVDEAARVAHEAYREWREVPVVDRIKPLFRLRDLLEENIEDLARTITLEAGKTYGESIGEKIGRASCRERGRVEGEGGVWERK